MHHEGPLLETLLHRLADCPAEFLAEPRFGNRGDVHVAAVVNDWMRSLGAPPLTSAQIKAFSPAEAKTHRNWLMLVLVACWLLDDPWFRQQTDVAPAALDFLQHGLTDVAAHASAPHFTTDPDRREELARLCLKALNFHPRGETPAQAQDRLMTMSSVERQRVVAAARAAEERARQIREEMARRAAQEAADKMGRE